MPGYKYRARRSPLIERLPAHLYCRPDYDVINNAKRFGKGRPTQYTPEQEAKVADPQTDLQVYAKEIGRSYAALRNLRYRLKKTSL